MSRKRISGAVVFTLCGALGCTAYPTMKATPPPPDCTLDSGYELDPVDLSTIFGYGDTTAGASFTATYTMPPDGPRCGDASVALFTAHHFNDWGAAAGFYGFHMVGAPPRDDSAYQGMSFWARAPGATGKSFTVALDDFNTFDPTPLPAGETDAAADPDPTDSNCVGYATADGGGQNITIYDPGTGQVLSSGSTTVTAINACGNSYSAVAVVTTDWRFYTIPFGQFHQTNTPNRVPNSGLMETGTAAGTTLLTSKLMLLTLRVPKEAEVELWIDKLGFYRNKGSAAGTDGGSDAR